MTATIFATSPDCPLCGRALVFERGIGWCNNVMCRPRPSKKGEKVTLPSGAVFVIPSGSHHYPQDGRCQCLACCGCPGDATRYVVAAGQAVWICQDCADTVSVVHALTEGEKWLLERISDPVLARLLSPSPRKGWM